MTRERIAQELLSLVDLLKRAEANYLSAVNTIAEFKLRLHGTECDLYNQEGAITGRNEAARAAELWPYTKELREKILRSDEEADRLKSEYYHVKRKWETYQTIAQLIIDQK